MNAAANRPHPEHPDTWNRSPIVVRPGAQTAIPYAQAAGPDRPYRVEVLLKQHPELVHELDWTSPHPGRYSKVAAPRGCSRHRRRCTRR
jgi:hypothetical protein